MSFVASVINCTVCREGGPRALRIAVRVAAAAGLRVAADGPDVPGVPPNGDRVSSREARSVARLSSLAEVLAAAAEHGRGRVVRFAGLAAGGAMVPKR